MTSKVALSWLLSIMRYFMSSNKTILIFRSSITLEIHEPTSSKPTVVVVLVCGALVIWYTIYAKILNSSDKKSNNKINLQMIFLVVPASEELKHSGIFDITDSFQDHVVSFLNCDEPNILHSLHERQSSSVCLSCLFLQKSIKMQIN